jgi:hypothetical protein
MPWTDKNLFAFRPLLTRVARAQTRSPSPPVEHGQDACAEVTRFDVSMSRELPEVGTESDSADADYKTPGRGSAASSRIGSRLDALDDFSACPAPTNADSDLVIALQSFKTIQTPSGFRANVGSRDS